MYFTNSPTLNSIEAIMKKAPYCSQRGGGINKSPYKYTAADCDCRYCLYFKKKSCTVPVCPVIDIRLECGAASFKDAVNIALSEVKHKPFQRRLNQI